MKVSVHIHEEEVEGDYGYSDGLSVTCSRCGYSVEVNGTGIASARYAASQLRAGCPDGEDYFYDVEWWAG